MPGFDNAEVPDVGSAMPGLDTSNVPDADSVDSIVGTMPVIEPEQPIDMNTNTVPGLEDSQTATMPGLDATSPYPSDAMGGSVFVSDAPAEGMDMAPVGAGDETGLNNQLPLEDDVSPLTTADGYTDDTTVNFDSLNASDEEGPLPGFEDVSDEEDNSSDDTDDVNSLLGNTETTPNTNQVEPVVTEEAVPTENTNVEPASVVPEVPQQPQPQPVVPAGMPPIPGPQMPPVQQPAPQVPPMGMPMQGMPGQMPVNPVQSPYGMQQQIPYNPMGAPQMPMGGPQMPMQAPMQPPMPPQPNTAYDPNYMPNADYGQASVGQQNMGMPNPYFPQQGGQGSQNGNQGQPEDGSSDDGGAAPSSRGDQSKQ
jgi:hypothetical protein